MDSKIVLSSVLIFAASLTLSGAYGNYYCQIRSCENLPHTMCRYPTDGPSYRCTDHVSSGLGYDEINTIVSMHNELRQRVASGRERRGSPGPQPAARSGMPNLEWDQELAMIAQRWADQCDWGHDQCRNVGRFEVGQNVAYVGTTGDFSHVKVESMVLSWGDEVKDFSRYEVARFGQVQKYGNRKVVGHYTQMAWAKTTKIGCGAVKYREGPWNKFYLVCNYGPAGNIVDDPVYV